MPLQALGPPSPGSPAPALGPPRRIKRYSMKGEIRFFIPLNTNFVKKKQQKFKDSKDRQMLKFEEISPKIQRMQILIKLAPQLPPIYLPPLALLGVKKNFGRFLASISAQV